MTRKTMITDNKTLIKLVKDDQDERKHFFDNPEKVTRHDTKRRKIISHLIRQNKLHTWKDYINAALIFQHGLTVNEYEQARVLAKKSIALGGDGDARHMYAVATDRSLIRQGKKQKFGTQFSILIKKNPKTGQVMKGYRLKPYDKRTSNKTRLKYYIAPIEKLLKYKEKPISKKK